MDLGSVPSCLLTFQAGAHSPGTLLPKGFFLFLGLLYLLALAADRWATKLGVPAALTVLVVGLVVNVMGGDVLAIDHAEVETLHVISLALLLFYAGLKRRTVELGVAVRPRCGRSAQKGKAHEAGKCKAASRATGQ